MGILDLGPRQAKFIMVSIIAWLLQGCVATSSMLNLTHTESDVLLSNWFIVVDEDDFAEWVTELNSNPELKVMHKDERSILAENQSAREIGNLWMVSYHPFTQDFWSGMESFRESAVYATLWAVIH